MAYVFNPFTSNLDNTGSGCCTDPHTEALFQITIDIANGVDIAATYMVNDLGETLINASGQLLEE